MPAVRPQFGKQEPADNPEVKKFAEGKGFTGPVFAKVDVNGPKGLITDCSVYTPLLLITEVFMFQPNLAMLCCHMRCHGV